MSDAPRSRKANLDSWISDKPNPAGYYEAKVWMGTKGDGSPDRRHVQRKTLAAARKRVKELEAQRNAGRGAKAGKPPTVRVMLERHLTTVLPGRGRAPRTIADYWSKCRNDIFPRWGGQRIDRLLPDQVEDGLAEMMAAGHKPSHVRKVHAILSSAYQDQVKNGIVGRNPLEHVKAPPADEPDVTALTQAQAQNIAAIAMSRPNGVRWSVGLATGLRQGEALALRWSYIDLGTGWMRIWHQLQRLTWEHGCADDAVREMQKQGKMKEEIAAAARKIEHGCAAGHCKKKACPRNCQHTRACPPPCPKDCTGHARLCPDRKLPAGSVQLSGGLALRPIKEKRRKRVKLPKELLPALKAHRDAQYLRRLTADDEWEENDLVFTQWNGRPVDPRRDWGEWQSILEAAGMPPRRLHIMRHTAATIMLERGVAIAVVMQALGHSDIRITSRYSHASEGLLEDAADRVGGLYAFDNETITGTKSGPAGQDH
jgi:integrase